MSEDLASALGDQIRRKTVIAVIGSGISVAVTKNAQAASWSGLLRRGIDRAAGFNPGLPDGWKARVLDELEYAEKNGYLPDFISVAEKITSALGGRGGGEFRAWMRADIGELRINDDPQALSLIRAIGDLGLPIVTTNYDELLEEGLSRKTATWRDPSSAQLIAQGTIDDILHLHGHWRSPDSIVLGAQSYGELLADQPAQAVERLLAGGRSLLFIGCGSGIEDPNFESLRKWLRSVFPDSESRHYLLCLEGERTRLSEVYSGERIVPLPYGDSYDALTPFLSSLASGKDPGAGGDGTAMPVAVGRVISPASSGSDRSRAAEAIQARVRSEVIIGDFLDNAESLNIDDILIPPVFLPVTQHQFSQSMHFDDDIRPERCDPDRDVREHGTLIVAAGETTGLTSALEWAVLRASRADESVIPVIVDFKQLGPGRGPLEKQVRKELKCAGVAVDGRAGLPKIAIAIDNFNVRPAKIFDRVVGELSGDAYTSVFLGCREGAEAEISDRLRGSGMSATLRYIGRLNGSDATKIASLVDPAQAERLAIRALEITQHEHLPRTPMIVGLLVCMLQRTETLLSAASPTVLLDAWVNLLLGRGDPHEDARFSLDSLDKAKILGYMAECFVRERAGSLSEAETLTCLERYFADVGWSEDPIAVLENFGKRHLLTIRNGQVKFSQSSYLYLFAAKRACDSKEFHEALLNDLIYFSPIIRHYAALTRNNVELLERAEQLLVPVDPSVTPPDGGIFADGGGVTASSIDELEKQLSLSGEDRDEDSRDGEDDEEGPSAWMDDFLDRVHEEDGEPFPVEALDDVPPVIRIITALSLVSNILRDSELVTDLELKKRVLRRALLIWGKLAVLLDSDDNLNRFWEEITDKVSAAMDIPEERRQKFREMICEAAPVLVGVGGISSNLSSRKLLRSLEACFEDDDFVTDPAGCVMGSMLAYDIHEPGWTGYMTELQRRHGRIKAVRGVVRTMAQASYYSETLSAQDDDRLLRFLVDQYLQEVRFDNAMHRKHAEDRIVQQLRRNRLQVRTRNSSGPKPRAILVRIDDPAD